MPRCHMPFAQRLRVVHPLSSLCCFPIAVAILHMSAAAPAAAAAAAASSFSAGMPVNSAASSSALSGSPPPSPSPDTPRDYPIFRKRFHIPSAWADRKDFQALDTHTYLSSNHVETMQFVGNTLKAMGYEGAGIAMKHDYLCFMLEDLLTSKGVPFLSERDLRKETELANFIGNQKQATPDLFLAFKNKWHLLDVYTGHKPEDEIKHKYKVNPAMYAAHIINTKFFRFCFEQELPGLLTDDDLKYLETNFAVFETEWQYWRSCFKMGQILFNSKPNLNITAFDFPADASEKKGKLKRLLLQKFGQAMQAAVVDFSSLLG